MFASTRLTRVSQFGHARIGFLRLLAALAVLGGTLWLSTVQAQLIAASAGQSTADSTADSAAGSTNSSNAHNAHHARASSNQTDKPETLWQAVRISDLEGKTSKEILQVSRARGVPPELTKLRQKWARKYLKARKAWSKAAVKFVRNPDNRGKDYPEPQPKRPSVTKLGQAKATKKQAHAIFDKQKARAKVKSNNAFRQRVLNELLLDHFNLGVMAPSSWFTSAKKTSGADLDIKCSYYAGGVKTSGGVKGQKLSWFEGSFIKDVPKADAIGWITFYHLAQSQPGNYKPGPAKSTPRNAKNKKTMHAYWTLFKRLMQRLNQYPNQPWVVQIEPDEWGHLLLAGNMDPTKVKVQVAGSGMPELAHLPDNEVGWAQAFETLRDRYAPRVLLCANPSAWDWQNSMSAAKWAKYLKQMGVTDWKLAVMQTHDGDIGQTGAKPPYTPEKIVSRFKSWPKLLGWLKEFHQRTGMYTLMWQMPVGNTYFRTCNNTDGHFCDGLVQDLLGNYPKSHLVAAFARAGCVGWIFQTGKAYCTRVYDHKKDGVTNPKPIKGNEGHRSKYPDDDGGYFRQAAGNYYKHPYPIPGR